MKRWAFISRDEPTDEQKKKAEEAGIELIPAGDRDAFGLDPFDRCGLPVDIEGIVCAHPALSVRALCEGYAVGVFEDISCPGPDGKPQFSVGRFFRWYPEPDQHPIAPRRGPCE